MNNTDGAIPPRPLDPTALQEKVLSMKTDPVMERLAVLFVVNCFRTTVLENYHAEWPEFTNDKMKALMKEAVNRLHTVLHAIFTGDDATHDAAWEVPSPLLQAPMGQTGIRSGPPPRHRVDETSQGSGCECCNESTQAAKGLIPVSVQHQARPRPASGSSGPPGGR